MSDVTPVPKCEANASQRDLLYSLLKELMGGIAVTGGLTDTELRASPIPVDAVVNVDTLNFDSTGLALETTAQAILTALGTLGTQTTLAAILVKLADPASQTTLAAILTKLADPATQTTLAAFLAANHTDLAEILTKLNAGLGVTGTFWQATQPVSLASAPLPTGAATSTKQDTLQTAIDAINTNTPAVASRTGTITRYDVADSPVTIAAGSKGLTFLPSSTFVGTIAGEPWNGSVDPGFEWPIPTKDTLGTVAITITGGHIRVIRTA